MYVGREQRVYKISGGVTFFVAAGCFRRNRLFVVMNLSHLLTQTPDFSYNV